MEVHIVRRGQLKTEPAPSGDQRHGAGSNRKAISMTTYVDNRPCASALSTPRPGQGCACDAVLVAIHADLAAMDATALAEQILRDTASLDLRDERAVRVRLAAISLAAHSAGVRR